MSNVLFILGVQELEAVMYRCISIYAFFSHIGYIVCLVEFPVLFSSSFSIINLIYISVYIFIPNS